MNDKTPAPAPVAQRSLLVVDDEEIVRESLGSWFRDEGWRVDVANGAAQAQKLVATNAYDIALIDIKMPKVDGLELQTRLAAACPDMAIIMMTAFESVDTAVRALKAGAFDYIVKPFDPDELTHLFQRVQEQRHLRSENARLKQSLDSVAPVGEIVGSSPPMQAVLDTVATVAPSEATVLVQGESGTGKELLARAIHAASPRRYGPLVSVHCGALAEGLLESELFGHERGAFTGAVAAHKGKFEQADGGTIFLDEIGDITPRMQVDLLRVLEEKTVTRVGGKTAIPVDFRVVAATNQDLAAKVKDGTFREELYYRLNVVNIRLPPLRERTDDILLLAQHFLQRFGKSMNRRDLRFDADALAALTAYSWPGNVRELQNAVERAVVLGKPPVIGRADLPAHVHAGPASSRPAVGSLADVEREHVSRVLEETGWNISRAAAILGVDRGTLYHKIERHGLQRTTATR